MKRAASSGLALILATAASIPAHAEQETWRLDNLSRIGGRAVTAAGSPHVIKWRGGSAIQFDGHGDSILLKGRPLVGAARFTVEALIRVDGGDFEQKFLHIAETDPATGRDVRPLGADHDANHRIMFELRAVKRGYYLDGFIKSTAGSTAVAVPDLLIPYGEWHAVAQTFDGSRYRTYVDGVLHGDVAALFAPQTAGNVRIGARMEQLHHFKGAIARIRFTDRALSQRELMTVPSAARN